MLIYVIKPLASIQVDIQRLCEAISEPRIKHIDTRLAAVTRSHAEHTLGTSQCAKVSTHR